MENVMMNSIRTQIKIVDFGLSNAYDPSSPLLTHCGSPEYAAPELFVPEKSYGPEVDLWSLGVILYGMVVGQLPFVTLREEHMSSQQRRKKLIVQINKGYSQTQRKALALVTPDFRSMISRMLMADAMKRITINELVLHAWVTDKGKKAIVMNPLKSLDEDWQISIMKQVGILLQLDWSTIRYAINSEPQGEIAGMYNILAYKLLSQRLEGDGVTRNLPNQIPVYVTPRPLTSLSPNRQDNLFYKQFLAKKRIEQRVKSPPIHKIQKVNIEGTPRLDLVKMTPEKRAQTAGISTKKARESPPVTAKIKEKKRIVPIKSSDVRIRLQMAAENKQNCKMERTFPVLPPTSSNRTASSPYKAQPTLSTAQKATYFNRQTVPQTINFKVLKNEIKIVGSKGLANSLVIKKSSSNHTKTSNEKETTTATSPRSSHTNIQTPVAINKTKSKTESAPARRVVTAPPPPRKTTLNRSVKRTRVMPVTGSPSTPSKPAPASSTPTARTRHTTTVRKTPGNYIELSPYVLGDVTKKRVSTTPAKRAQNTMLNEPIAKSIVDYITRKIPGKLEVSKRGRN